MSVTTEALREEAAMYMGHGSNTGGLQRHSIGDSFPFMVVGTMHKADGDDTATEHTRYYVLDTSTGDKFYWNPLGAGPITWPDIRSAEMVARHIHDGYIGPAVQRIPA